MNLFDDPDNPDKDNSCLGDNYVGPGKSLIDTQVQLVISVSMGLSAFLSFCVGIPFLFESFLQQHC
jgi:hypothetical protein